MAASAQASQASKWERVRAAAGRNPHGTNARYASGCRCESCRLSHNDYTRNRPCDRGHGRTVSTEPARQHVLELSKKGMGYLAIAEAAGVNHSTLWGIRQGERPRARYGTVQKILAVDLSCSRDGARIPAGPTWKILDQLLADGYTKTQLAAWLGFSGKPPALHFSRDMVTAGNASRVQRMAKLIEMGFLERGEPSLLSTKKPRGHGPGRGRGKLSDAPRCACRKMTLKCAKARAHHCPQPAVAGSA